MHSQNHYLINSINRNEERGRNASITPKGGPGNTIPIFSPWVCQNITCLRALSQTLSAFWTLVQFAFPHILAKKITHNSSQCDNITLHVIERLALSLTSQPLVPSTQEVWSWSSCFCRTREKSMHVTLIRARTHQMLEIGPKIIKK